ncbi:hypothetical protein DLM75_21395 [Leptospira stimsonii]|uniref:Uncharacterized protein n=1 Tax=Leptospira stimsonii TaxID=2202203 RepID=A0A396YVU3_9LEPT|nr:hypothetical protein DLM75_21395 [Leptospira stimsonii]
MEAEECGNPFGEGNLLSVKSGLQRIQKKHLDQKKILSIEIKGNVSNPLSITSSIGELIHKKSLSELRQLFL